jgi:hypothetical protein
MKGTKTQILSWSYLGLFRLSFMVGHANVIEDPVQLTDDLVDLGGQIAGVDRHIRNKGSRFIIRVGGLCGMKERYQDKDGCNGRPSPRVEGKIVNSK